MTQTSLPLDDAREVFTVSEILAETRWALESTFTGLWVRGEVTGLKALRSGHWYFGLKDENAVLPVAMFRGDNRRVPFDLEEGMEVTASGRLTIYEPQGKFQLIANSLEPAGWGGQQLAFEQLKRRLREAGLFDEARKRPLPLLPRCIGVVTSASGAAWHDMRKVWRRRRVASRAILAPARVQGEYAAGEIAAAIQLLIEHGDAEVIIVGRGGGSREDLWAFNEEVVARAVATCPVPVVSAVGHEVDFTITDLAADRRAATPTAAAEIVAPSTDELVQRLDGLRRRTEQQCRNVVAVSGRRLHAPGLGRSLREPVRAIAAHQQRIDIAWDGIEATLANRVQKTGRRLGAMSRALLRHEPTGLLARNRTRLETLGTGLRTGMQARLQKQRARLGATAARTQAMSPLAVLGRGYALCQDARGQLLRDATAASLGDLVRVRLARGELRCEVTATEVTAGDQ
jgi:exodeoxyribonuclease VII large subunit